MKSTLSVAVACSNPIDMYFPFKELLLSVKDLAQEIVVVNCDEDEAVISGNSQVDQIVDEVMFNSDKRVNIKTYYLPWQEHMMKNMEMLAKTAAISQCTKDYVLLLDADEIIHEDNHDHIRRLIELDHGIYSFRTIHFYRDYDHFKNDNAKEFYNHRPKLFRNFEGTFDGYQSWYTGLRNKDFIKSEYTADLVTWNYESANKYSKKVVVPIYHYGWVRPTELMLDKQNKIDNRYHRDFKDRPKWEWDMTDTSVFHGEHPEVMKERIREFTTCDQL